MTDLKKHVLTTEYRAPFLVRLKYLFTPKRPFASVGDEGIFMATVVIDEGEIVVISSATLDFDEYLKEQIRQAKDGSTSFAIEGMVGHA